MVPWRWLCAARFPEASVRLWGRNPERMAAIRESGFDFATTDLAQAIQDADLIILAVPVGAMAALGEQLLAAEPASGAVLTDVGSVKVRPHETIGALLAARGYRFAGSHPMAGSEHSGFEAAQADLFEGAPCILTNDQDLPAEDLDRLRNFWIGLGAHPVVMTAPEHDHLVARISHVPHVLAAVCALVALEEDGASLAGGGLRDTSRVAGGDPRMWTEILCENNGAITGPLRESAALLTRIADFLEQGEETALRETLEMAQQRRRLLSDHPQSTTHD